MVKSQHSTALIMAGLALLGMVAWVSPAVAQEPGCQAELRGERGSRVTAGVLDRDPSGSTVPVANPATTVGARSGQILRLSVRPIQGAARPDGPGCPIRVSLSRLTPVARLLAADGFIIDRNTAYAMVRPDEERVIELQVKPFSEWNSVSREIEIEDLKIELPEAAEFVAILPPPYDPPAGTVCAEVIYSDARPAPGVALRLTAPPESEPNERVTGSDGRACWDGFDELLFGGLSLSPDVDAALGQPEERYVSREARYRLFVVKRPR